MPKQTPMESGYIGSTSRGDGVIRYAWQWTGCAEFTFYIDRHPDGELEAGAECDPRDTDIPSQLRTAILEWWGDGFPDLQEWVDWARKEDGDAACAALDEMREEQEIIRSGK